MAQPSLGDIHRVVAAHIEWKTERQAMDAQEERALDGTELEAPDWSYSDDAGTALLDDAGALLAAFTGGSASLLRVIGGLLADVKGNLEASDKADEKVAAGEVDDALDDIDSAIRTLEDELDHCPGCAEPLNDEGDCGSDTCPFPHVA